MSFASRQLRRSRLIGLAAAVLGVGCRPAPARTPEPAEHAHSTVSIVCDGPTCAPSEKPLYVIDGVAVDPTRVPLTGTSFDPSGRFKPLAPSEIDSITVMKGPNAMQKFGPAARNGVVQIWTKRGVKVPPPDTGKVQPAPPSP